MRRSFVADVVWVLVLSACSGSTGDMSAAGASSTVAIGANVSSSTSLGVPLVTTSTPEPPTIAQTTTPTAAQTTAQTTTPTDAGTTVRTIELRSDGLGVVAFGDEMQEATATLIGLLGESDESQSEAWLGDSTVWVHWEKEGLNVFFSDSSRYRDDGVIHLFQWSYSGLEFTTRDGFGVGATVEDLRSAYGDRLTITDFTDCGVSRNELSLDNAIRFNLGAGDPVDPDSRVEALYAGAAPSCD